jgi:hypothetical protein
MFRRCCLDRPTGLGGHRERRRHQRVLAAGRDRGCLEGEVVDVFDVAPRLVVIDHRGFGGAAGRASARSAPFTPAGFARLVERAGERRRS